jgi:tetratricopeptide (TPR) repeat protein
LVEILSSEHPAIVEYSISLAGSYINLGELAERSDDPATALNWLKKGENVLLGVLASQPRESKARYFMSYDYSWQARAYDSERDNNQTAQSWERAIQYDDHNDPTLRVGRALALVRLGNTAAATALTDKLVAENPQTDAMFELAGVYALAAAALSTQNAELAMADGAKSVALLRRVAAAGYFRVPEQLQKLKTASEFSAIRNRTDFKRMLATLDSGN